VFDENIVFGVQLGFSPGNLGLEDGAVTHTPLLDYYFDFQHVRDINVLVGQYSIPFTREGTMSSGELVFVDRTIADNEFGAPRDVGITLHSDDFLGLNHFRYYAGIFSGAGRDGILLDCDCGPAYVVRIEAHPTGLFDNYDQVDFQRSSDPRLAFGAAYFLHNSVHRSTVDALLFWHGAALEASLFHRFVDETNASDIGFFVQANTLIPGTVFGVAGRYGRIAGFEHSLLESQNELGAGLNYFFEKHTLKLQLDGFHMWGGRYRTTEQLVRLQLQVKI
jgi:hypothetical protein